MDLYVAYAVETGQFDSALDVLSDVESWPVSLAWKRRFLVQRQMLVEGVGNDYFQSTMNTFERIQWLETHYQNGHLYEYLMAVNQSALGQFDLLLQREFSLEWPLEIQSYFLQLQFLGALQQQNLDRTSELLDSKNLPQIDEYRRRVRFLQDYFD